MAFSYCPNLTEITIPDSVTAIEYNAFSYSENLTAINVSENNPVYCEDGGILFNKDKTELECYPAGIKSSTYSIPDSVKIIGDCALLGCNNLTSVVIPDSVTRIGHRGFAECSKLESISIPDSVTEMGVCVFLYCDSLKSVKLSVSMTEIPNETFLYCSSLTDITIPDTVKSIGFECFGNCSSLEDVNIPDSATTIYAGAFQGTSIREITVPDSVTTMDKLPPPEFFGEGGIGETPGTFGDCKNLEKVTLSSRMTSIGSRMFFNCPNLQSITIPESITSIDCIAFCNCTNLNSIKIENPDCEIYDSSGTISNGYGEDGDYIFNGTIYGYENSTAQAYAEKYDCKFESLGAAPEQPKTEFGDIDGDGAVNSSDASYVLSEYARIATGGAPTFSEAQKTAADVNGDNAVDSSDASTILAYYAYTATGGTGTITDFMKK